jgi:prepilin-type N-terminal cleavage/methylation domain-containing protein
MLIRFITTSALNWLSRTREIVVNRISLFHNILFKKRGGYFCNLSSLLKRGRGSFSEGGFREARHGARDRGFTLLELLLGISLFSVVAVCIYSTFWAGVKLSRRSENEGGSYREAHWALEIMAKDMENTVPYDFSSSYPGKTAFEGGENKITFMTSSQDGLKAVSYYLVSPEETRIHQVVVGAVHRKNVGVTVRDERARRPYCLVREERDFVDFLQGGPDGGGTSEVMASNMQEDGLKFSFGYLKEGEDRLYVWKDTWQNPYPPRAVRVEMDFFIDGGDGTGGSAEPTAAEGTAKQETVRLDRRILIPHGAWGKEAS